MRQLLSERKGLYQNKGRGCRSWLTVRAALWEVCNAK